MSQSWMFRRTSRFARSSAGGDRGVRGQRALGDVDRSPKAQLGEPDGVGDVRTLARQGLGIDEEALHDRGQDRGVRELGDTTITTRAIAGSAHDRRTAA